MNKNYFFDINECSLIFSECLLCADSLNLLGVVLRLIIFELNFLKELICVL